MPDVYRNSAVMKKIPAPRRGWRAGLLLAPLFLASTAAGAPPSALPPEDSRKLARAVYQEQIGFESTAAIGTEGAAAALAGRLRAGGFDDVLVLAPAQYPKKPNVVVRLKGRGKGRPVLWICHLDVVEARAEDWTLPPFELTEKDGYFYGRGASDMKDNVAAVTAGLVRLKQEGYVPDRDIIAAFTADEETGSEANGVAFLLREHKALVDAGLSINPDVNGGALQNGVRRDFSVETSEKTYATFTLEVTNKGGHSSQPRPDNAIYALAAGLARLAKYTFPVVLSATTREYFAHRAALETGEKKADLLAVAAGKPDLAAAARLSADAGDNALLHTTCVATMLSGGHAENALPQRAGATIQCRLLPGDTKDAVMKTLAGVLADPDIKIGVIEPVLEAPESPPTRELMASVAKAAHSMWPGVPVLPVMAQGASDCVFTRNAGIPSYGISGVWADVNDDRSHGRDERELVSSFYENVEFTYRLMKELTGGGGY